MKKQAPMTIGVLAKSADVGVETIRFYERKEIIRQPPKTDGFRHYSDEDVRRVRLVKKLQEIGFSLNDVKDFLEFDSCCGANKHVIRQKSEEKITEINQKISDLTNALHALTKFSNACGTNKDTSLECDLLECFENEWKCCDASQETTSKTSNES